MNPLLVCSYFAVSLVALAICVAVIVRDYKKEEFRDPLGERAAARRANALLQVLHGAQRRAPAVLLPL